MPAIQPYSLLGVTATLNIFNGFQTYNYFLAAKQREKAAEFHLKRAEEQKRSEIRTLFYKALGSQVLVTVADQNIETLQSHLKDVNSRVRSGVSTRYDSLRADVQLEDAQTEKISAENSVVIARAKLFESIGIPDDGKPLEGKLPENFDQDTTKLKLENTLRSDRSALVEEKEAFRSLSSASKSHWYPSVSLFGNYEKYNNINHAILADDERFKTAYAVGVLMKWNLFDGGEDWASQNQAAIESEIAELNLAKMDQNIPIALEEAKRRFSYDVTNYKAKVSSIKKAEEAVRLARGGVRAGTRTGVEVLDAVVDLNRAKAAAVKSQVDAIEALGQLELAVGHSL
jgi:outer membrane protein TolC